jgi:peptidoglycan hydrolase-like protein with peptidoglycan-binding domain
MLTGGKPQGVGADSGPDSGRDKSHLWHIHISFIRKFAELWDAFERVLSILKGETYSAWAKRHNVVVAPKPQPTKPKPQPTKPVGLPSYKNGSRELKAGMRGTDVKYVQTFIGPSRMGKADGVAGPKFTAGVKWYQRMRGLSSDGIVGKRTWSNMGVR